MTATSRAPQRERPSRRHLTPIAVAAATCTVLALSLAGTSTALASPARPAAVGATVGDGLDGGTVFLSEVFTHGADAPNDDVTGGDSIELHNASTTAEPIAGAILSDNDNTHELVIPADTPDMPAGSYMTFRTDAMSAGGAAFSLGDQDEARLFAPGSDITSATPSDEFDWNHSPVYSWARDFDHPTTAGDPSTAPWQASGGTTPGDGAGTDGANNFTPAHTDLLTGVVINEVNMNGDAQGGHGDWIELYNTGASEVDLTGAILSDNDDTHAYIIGAPDHSDDQTTLAPKGTTGDFAAYQVDSDDVNGSFGLGGSDAARLYSGANLDLYGNGAAPDVTTQPDVSGPGGAPTVDKVIWATAPVHTLGRIPDGSGATGASMDNSSAFQPTDAPTYDATNGGTTPPPPPPSLAGVEINEVKTTGDPVNGDWIELINTNTSGSVDLSGAILSDDNDAHIITLADNPTTDDFEHGDVLAIRTDNPDPDVASGSFGLGDQDAARLFPANTTDLSAVTPVDSIAWNDHTPTSLGRFAYNEVNLDATNSADDWGPTNNPTFNTANDFTNDTDYTVDPADNVFTGQDFIQINETESSEVSGEVPQNDYIELINTAPVPIDVTNMVLSDDGGKDGTDAIDLTLDDLIGGVADPTMTGDVDIAANGIAYVKVDDTDVPGNFGLGSDDQARLFATGADVQTSIPIDHFEWTDHAQGSYQRQDNGLGGWLDCTPPTAGTANTSGAGCVALP